MSTSSSHRPTSRGGPATRSGGAATTPAGGGGAARTAAIGLWVLVGAGLLYGVTQTAIRAAQLFQ